MSYTKICHVCKQLLDSRCFYADSRSSDGRSHRCKECAKQQKKLWLKSQTAEQNRKHLKVLGDMRINN